MCQNPEESQVYVIKDGSGEIKILGQVELPLLLSAAIQVANLTPEVDKGFLCTEEFVPPTSKSTIRNAHLLTAHGILSSGISGPSYAEDLRICEEVLAKLEFSLIFFEKKERKIKPLFFWILRISL